jgi:alpha-mannosidase
MKIQEILLVPHTHHDIGYTHIPEVCLRMHQRYIAEAVRLCEEDLHEESPAAFRWTVEISQPLVNYLRKASAQDMVRLQNLIQCGRLAATGAYAHMTQLVGHEEYVRFFYPVRILREEYKLPVSVVQHGDINGLSWGVVPFMQEAELDSGRFFWHIQS